MTAGQLICVALLGAALGVWTGHAVAVRIYRAMLSPRRAAVAAAMRRHPAGRARIPAGRW